MGKEKFIGNYINSAMKNHNLPYGGAYLNMLAEVEIKAEKKWKAYLKRYSTAKQKGSMNHKPNSTDTTD